MCPRCFPLEFQLEKLKGQTVNALTFYPPDHLISRMKNKQENFPFLIFSTTSSTTKIPFQRNIDVVFFFFFRKFNFVVRPRISSDYVCFFVFFFFMVRKIVFLPCRFTSPSFIFVKIYSHAQNSFTRVVCLCTFITLLFAFFFSLFDSKFSRRGWKYFWKSKNSRHLFFLLLLFFYLSCKLF